MLVSATDLSRHVTVEARPNPLPLDPAETAVIVVDMQNDFGAEGGMFARAGAPIGPIQAVVEPTARVLAAARRAGMKVVYLKMEDLSNAGGPDAPNRVRHVAFGVGKTVEAPDGRESRVLIKDTWDTEVLPELAPRRRQRDFPRLEYTLASMAFAHCRR